MVVDLADSSQAPGIGRYESLQQQKPFRTLSVLVQLLVQIRDLMKIYRLMICLNRYACVRARVCAWTCVYLCKLLYKTTEDQDDAELKLVTRVSVSACARKCVCARVSTYTRATYHANPRSKRGRTQNG